MTRIVVAGAMGRMGARIASLGLETEGIELAGGFERKGHPDTGKDMGEMLGLGRKLGIALSDDIKSAAGRADVVIDFTSPASTLDDLRACAEHGKAMVIGTTGFKPDELEEIKNISSRVPCVMASNMSLGINLLAKVVASVATALGQDYDIEIIEAHHRLKKDAPSGTALMLAKSITAAIGQNLDDVAVYARKGMIGERTKGEIGIQTIRAGDIVGEHTVIFGGLGERIEITHKASSRDTFARGALRAALWLSGKKPGLYDMQDVLGLK